MIARLRKEGARGAWGRDDSDPLAHRGLPDMRLVGRGARAPAAAVLPLLPASAEVTLEVLACGGGEGRRPRPPDGAAMCSRCGGGVPPPPPAAPSCALFVWSTGPRRRRV